MPACNPSTVADGDRRIKNSVILVYKNKFAAVLVYRGSLRVAWATCEPVSKQNEAENTVRTLKKNL